MSKLIDAEKLDFVSYQGIPDGYKDSFDSGILYAMNLIDDQPTIDAVPVKHGHWIKDRERLIYQCSVCGAGFQNIGYGYDYCPECRARMDEVEHD